MTCCSRTALTTVVVLSLVTGARSRADEQGEALISAARKAIGAEAKWTALKSLSAQGEYRRVLDGNDISGELALKFVFPDRFQRVEHVEFPGGRPGMSMATTLDGEDAWRGPLGGMPMGFRRGPGFGGGPGGGFGPPPDVAAPDGAGAAAPDSGAPDAAAGGGGQARGLRGPRPGGPGNPAFMRRSVTDDYLRTLLAILPHSPASHPLTFEAAGTAASPDGTADVLNVSDADGFQAQLFLDQKTHLPLMMTFKASDPRRGMRGRRMGAPGGGAGPGAGPGGASGATPDDPEARRRRFEEMRQRRAAQGPPQPPPVVAHTWFFSEHKSVDGLMLPHAIKHSVENQAFEEWTISRYRVNAKIDEKDFKRPSRQ